MPLAAQEPAAEEPWPAAAHRATTGLSESVDHRWVGGGIAFARERDRRGDRVHVALACLYLACAGIATSVESIAFALLAGYSLLRFWALWRTWVHVVCYPATWALAAWLAWSTLSLLWSPDMDAGLGTLRGSRAMLLLFAIFPVSDRWPLLVSSFLFGLSAQACLQFGQSFGLLEGDPTNPIRHAGLFSHPGYLSTFYAVAIVLALSWAAALWRRRSALLLLGAMALSVAGLGIAAGRGAILGLLVGVPLTAALELRRRLSPMRLAGVCAALPLLLALLVAGVPLALGSQGMTAKIREFRSVAQVTTPSGLRLLYWSASWDAFLERPVAGIGAGGTHHALASTARMRKAESENAGRDPQFFATSQPHSVYVQTLLEQGVIGAVAMATALFAAARLALRRCDDLAIGAGLVGALAIWAVSAAFDALHLSGRTASLACALIALSMGGAAAGAAWRWPERWARRWLEPWLGRLVQRWRARGAAAP